MPAPLAIGLTPFQRQRVADMLRRVGRVPLGQVASVFMDVDVAAARVLKPVRPSDADCATVADELGPVHGLDSMTLSFCLGLAIGIRQGRTFIQPERRKPMDQRGIHTAERRPAERRGALYPGVAAK